MCHFSAFLSPGNQLFRTSSGQYLISQSYPTNIDINLQNHTTKKSAIAQNVSSFEFFFFYLNQVYENFIQFNCSQKCSVNFMKYIKTNLLMFRWTVTFYVKITLTHDILAAAFCFFFLSPLSICNSYLTSPVLPLLHCVLHVLIDRVVIFFLHSFFCFNSLCFHFHHFLTATHTNER